jgi:photosynthetic reaction center H subunit
MQTGAITGYIDVAQVALYTFWLFFAGLIYYLRREDKREGYPLVGENGLVQGFPQAPPPKTFLLANGGTVTAPRVEAPQPSFSAEPVAAWPGAPMQPLGNPLLAAVGPGASALRSDSPDLMWGGSELRVVPLRVATDHFLDEESPDPRRMMAVGADGVVAGVVSDAWVDRAEAVIRYLEVALTGGGSVLVPMPLIRVNDTAGTIAVKSIMGAQFADAPRLASPDQVTLREEDRIAAYFASGNLFADPIRMEPLL